MILFCSLDYTLVDPHHVSEIVRTEPGNLLRILFMEELRFLLRVNKEKRCLLCLRYYTRFTGASLGIRCMVQGLKNSMRKTIRKMSISNLLLSCLLLFQNMWLHWDQANVNLGPHSCCVSTSHPNYTESTCKTFLYLKGQEHRLANMRPQGWCYECFWMVPNAALRASSFEKRKNFCHTVRG